MDKFYVVTNSMKDTDFKVTNQIQEYLTFKGKQCILNQGKYLEKDGTFRYTDPCTIPKDTDCILVVGGDGTLIRSARDLVGYDYPLVGVNFGKLGYLAEIEKENIIPSLDKLMADEYYVEERMMLEGTLYRDGKVFGKDIALNDIVLNRSGMLRVIEFKIYVNGEFLNLYSADGIIISTPTGSTAYNLSAGGPIVSPDASLILITPICPHALNTRSIVLPSTDKIVVELSANRNGREEERLVSYDGDNTFHLLAGDTIEIKRSVRNTKVLRLNRINFLEVLRIKMKES
ncbi:MAG: NAD(+)/NADH kinase [Clostridiales bacterium]|nr:NAD(+)/NADH kinase [Clostridiales bacterium]